MKQGFVYFMSNQNRTSLYIGVTNNLQRRVYEHKTGKGSVFTKRYALNALVYYEAVPGIKQAIAREKQLKNWQEWKWNLVKLENPELKDLSDDWFTDAEMTENKVVQGDPETSSG